MRLHNGNRNIWGRRLVVLLLLCGLLLPLGQPIQAAAVEYDYSRITDKSGLPTDDQWHDYFIAWEDLDNKNKVWFTNYHWYTEEGDNNIDCGGLLHMKYKSNSTLPDSQAKTFTSTEALGHMQIKYAGKDSDNGDSPKYYIRVSKMTGGYSYFTGTEPVDKESEADAFTFQDKGDVFHIFVNVSALPDQYLVRNGDMLETWISTYGGGEDEDRELRVYKRTFRAVEDDTGTGDEDSVLGKVTLYEYNWIDDEEELAALTGDKNTWHDVFLAWEDCDEDNDKKNNPDKVWYTKELWFDEDGKPNFGYSDYWLVEETYYWSNATLGSDGYSSHDSKEPFLMPYEVGHFQMRFSGWDDDNSHKMGSDYWGDDITCPTFNIRFSSGGSSYTYMKGSSYVTSADDASDYTVQLQLDGAKREYYGSVHLFINIKGRTDTYLTRKGNRFDDSLYSGSDDWEFPFRIYTRTPVEYDAIVRSFTVGAGATYSIDRHLVLKEGVTVTVEDGGVLMVDNQFYNNGHIVVKDGGTVIVNEGGYIMPFNNGSGGGSITLDGGSMVIMDGAKVLCDDGEGTLELKNGATVVNRGVLLAQTLLSIQDNSVLINESDAILLLGKRLDQHRGAVLDLDVEQFPGYSGSYAGALMLANRSKLINNGTICMPRDSLFTWHQDGTGSYVENGVKSQS